MVRSVLNKKYIILKTIFNEFPVALYMLTLFSAGGGGIRPPIQYFSIYGWCDEQISPKSLCKFIFICYIHNRGTFIFLSHVIL